MKRRNLIYSCLMVFAMASCSSGNDALTIRAHLDANGTGTYRDVSTGTNSTLGYSGDTFFVSSFVATNSLVSSSAVAFDYGSADGTAVHIIKSGSTTMYNATYACHTVDHLYDSIEITALSVCLYSTKTELTYVAQISIDAIKLAVNAASQYLSSKGLPYIY